MKTLTKLGIFGAIALMLTCFSCKKDDEVKPMAPPPTTLSTGSTMYSIVNYGSNSFNVNDSIYMLNDSTLTIPVNYGLDTMHMSYAGMVAGYPLYSIDHVVKNNSAYHLVGNMYNLTDSTIYVSFTQRISPFGVGNVVQSYDLTYKEN